MSAGVFIQTRMVLHSATVSTVSTAANTVDTQMLFAT